MSLQMLFMGEYDWFKNFTGGERKASGKGESNNHQAAYKELKAEWQKNALEVFFRYFPKVWFTEINY